mgnify:CR=1 FL=1
MTGILKPTKDNTLLKVHPGDIVRVHQKIKEGGKERIQVFEGIVIKTHGKTGPSATFTVRKITYGVGVERTYLLQSPSIVKIEFKKGSEVRRAKLYYLRKLSGKSLKMKEKKIDQDVWELVAKATEPEELSEEVLAEAVQAESDRKKSEQVLDASETSSAEEITESKDDTVEAEASVGEDKSDSQS